MTQTTKIVAVLIIFITLIIGGVFLMVMKEQMVGSNMITAAISFATGAGIMVINQEVADMKRNRDSLPPPFGKPDRGNNGKGER